MTSCRCFVVDVCHVLLCLRDSEREANEHSAIVSIIFNTTKTTQPDHANNTHQLAHTHIHAHTDTHRHTDTHSHTLTRIDTQATAHPQTTPIINHLNLTWARSSIV